MPTFIYKALDSGKQVTTGTFSAHDKKEVAAVLSKKGLSPLTISLVAEKTQIKGTVPTIDKVTFCRYLAAMLNSGLALSDGIEVMLEESKNVLMRKILSDMSYSLEQGQQLSSVFERYPSVFEPYFLTLIRAGEVSGKLGEVFKYLEAQLRSEYALSSKVKGALLYPGIVFTAMIGIGFLMFFFVLPQIGKVFLNLKLPLPAFTKALFTVSLVLSSQIVPIIVLCILGTVGLFFALKNRAIRNILSMIIRPLPLISNFIKRVDLARFNRIFSTLLISAVPITEALEISLNSLSWYEYKKISSALPEQIRKGKSLASAMKENRVFPSLMIQMVAAGEKSGTLDSSLSDLATFYEQEVEEELKNLTQILEPILMLLVGISVGVMILAIIAPIYSVVGSFQSVASPAGPR